jgi:predicted ATPase
VVVEDVHWADEATMDLLRFAGRRLREARVLLVVTFRDDDLAADDSLRIALGELARQRSTRRISLTCLSAAAVHELASGSGLEPAALYRLTGGNPFYVTEVLRAGMAEVPASARDAVLARAAGLGADARQLLEVAALTGSRVEAGLLEATAGCPPPAVDGRGIRVPGRHGRGPVRRAGGRADPARPGRAGGRGLQARAGTVARGRRPAA